MTHLPYTCADTGDKRAMLLNGWGYIIGEYAHRPAPSGLHAKFLRELSERSPYTLARSYYGRPNHVSVLRKNANGPNDLWWEGHRDSMPREYRGAHDPDNLLTCPASD